MAEKKKKRKTGTALFFIPAFVCIALGLGWLSYNLLLIRKVELESNEMLQELLMEESAHKQRESETEDDSGTEESGEESVIWIDPKSGEIETVYELDPEAPMPTKKVAGKTCIGVLNIPDLDIAYPIISTWNYVLLESAPCRFAGSVYSRDIIICAHNYTGNFGKIGKLEPGAEFSFTDMDGHVFYYEVMEVINLKPTEMEKLLAGDWDMTLFTCTRGAKWRITVRCRLKNAGPAEKN